MTIITVVLLLAGIWAWSPFALALDVFITDRDVSHIAINVPGSQTGYCKAVSVPVHLTLEDMIERVLCNNPQLRQVWANAKAQAAEVGVKRSAYLPKLNAGSGFINGVNDTVYDQRQDYARHGKQRRFESILSFSWVLFDFGRREAALQNAQHLLIAANANQDQQLQEAFVLAAQLYYDALAAQGRQIAASKVAAMAAENLRAADAKYAAGAAALSDRLQAQTAYSQASLNEVRSEGVSQHAKGSIALLMGLPPHTSFKLAGNLSRRPDTGFGDGVDDLLDQAKRNHPSLIAAKARREAARSVINESKAAGRPSISFIANLSDVRTNQSMEYNGDIRVRDNSVGLQLNIPLFEGFERTYQVRKARSHFEASEAELSYIEQRVSLQLWDNYQMLGVETRSLERSADWVDQSKQALEVTQGRYRSGVGNMIEILNALNAYASAEQQHINSLSSWQLARLKLAENLGRLGFWAL